MHAQQKTIGQIVKLDPHFDDLISPDAKIEALADTLPGQKVRYGSMKENLFFFGYSK
jgi:hypothetical protein